jgi:hypothetical protein
MIVVTGSVVTEQPGQTTYEQHVDTIIDTYAMIAEIFPDSFIFPVVGVTDVYPIYYSKFDYSSTASQVTVSEELHLAIKEDWNTNYLNFDDGVDDEGKVNDMGFYHLEYVPYSSSLTTNADTSATETTPNYLADTEFIALNTNACYTGNPGLLDQLLDPGLQLAWFREKLENARQNGKTVILAGHMAPGNLLCNR